ncbi:MAG: V-type ATP synthase subunit E [Fibrobacter sp.]|nr:V-type ATP synthase subunit E [Fibrobacter sp.]
MEQKIQELTEKIYQEGVEKGEQKATQIISEAEGKAAGIIGDAKAEAEKIIADARTQAQELKRNTESELKLTGSQALSAIKQQILDLVTAKVIEDSTTQVLADPSNVKDFVSTVIQNWNVTSGEAPRLEVLLPANKQEELKKSFEKSASDLLKKNIDLSFTKSIKSGFRIGPVGGGYRISLTDEDFQEFFKEYLRPRTRQYLFGE